jgi:hypothetical protein
MDMTSIIPTPDADDVIDRLRRADPWPPSTQVTPALVDQLDALSRSIAGDRVDAAVAQPVPIRRGRRALTGLIAAAVVVVATASLAAAGVFTTHTGQYGAPHMTENDTSELLRVDAPDFPALALRLARGIPYPPGDRAANYLHFLIRPNTEMQAKGITGHFAGDAQCAWYGYWLQARHDGNTAAATTALHQIAALPSWKAITDVDSGGPTYAAWARAAAAGDTAPIQQFVTVNCAGLPQAWSGR